MRTRYSCASLVVALLHATAAGAIAQTASPVSIYVDCKGMTCDLDYLRTEIAFVSHVRDRHDAEVHILITAQPTAEGGTEATVSFIGQKQFSGLEDALQFVSRPGDAPDRVRQGLADAIKRGLVRYISRTPMAEDITVLYAPKATAAAAAVRDPWNRWTFASNANGFITGEETFRTVSVGGAVSANRVTEASKISASIQSQYDRSEFEVDDRTVTNVQRSHGFSTLLVKSVNAHVSIGARLSALSSRFLNQQLTLRAAPAVELNVFKYSESTRRMLTLEYSIGGNAFDYEERTIFGRTSERLLDHRLLASLRLAQPWGSVEIAGEGSHYLQDTRKHRGAAFGTVNWNVARGLSLLTSVDVKRIRDQIFLAARGVSDEEVLLRQRQLATSYSYSASLGINYTFGSRYASIVNRRFAGSLGSMNVVQ